MSDTEQTAPQPGGPQPSKKDNLGWDVPIYDVQSGTLNMDVEPPNITRYIHDQALKGNLVNLTDPNQWNHMRETEEELRWKYGASQKTIKEMEAKANLKGLFKLEDDELEMAYQLMRGPEGQKNGLGQSVGEFGKNLGKAIRASHIQQKLGKLYFDVMMVGANEKLLAEIEQWENAMPQDYDGNFVQNAANMLVSLIPQMEHRWRGALPTALGTAGVAAAASVASGPFSALATGGGFAFGLALASIEEGWEIMSGLKYRELSNLKAQDGTSLKPATMRAIALTTGAVQSLVEVPSQLTGMSFVPGLAQAISGKGAKVAQSALQKFLNSAMTPGKLTGLAKVVQHSTGEGVEEFSQGIADMISKYVATEMINEAAAEGVEIDYDFTNELHHAVYEGIMGTVAGFVTAGAGQFGNFMIDRHGRKVDTQHVAKKAGVTEAEVAPFKVEQSDSELTVRKHRYVTNERAKDFNRMSKYKPSAKIADQISDPYLQRVAETVKYDQARATEMLSREKQRLGMVERAALSDESKMAFDQELEDLAFIAPDGKVKMQSEKLSGTIFTNDTMNEVSGFNKLNKGKVPGTSHNTVFINRQEIAHYMGLDENSIEVRQMYERMRKRAQDGKFSISLVRPEFEMQMPKILEENQGKWFDKTIDEFDKDAKVDEGATYLIKLFPEFAAEKQAQGYKFSEIVEMYNERIKTDNKLLSGEYAIHPAFQIFMKDPTTDKVQSLNKDIMKNRKKKVEAEITEQVAREEGLIDSGEPADMTLQPEDQPVQTEQKPTAGKQDKFSKELSIQEQDRLHVVKLKEQIEQKTKGGKAYFQKLNEVSEATYKRMQHIIDNEQKVQEIRRERLRTDPYYHDQKKQAHALMNSFDRIKEVYFQRARSMDALEFPDSIKKEMNKVLGREYGSVRKLRSQDHEKMRAIFLHIEAKNLPPEVVEVIQNHPEAKRLYDNAMSLTKEEIKVSDMIESRMKEMVEEAKANNVIDWEVNNYIPHYWEITPDKTKPDRKLGSSSSFSPFTKHNMARKYDTVFEGVMAGRKFENADPVADLFKYEMDMQASMAAKDFIEIGRKVRNIDGTPFLSVNKMENYAPIKHDAFKVDTPIEGVRYEVAQANDNMHNRRTGDGPNDWTVFMESELYAPVEVAKFIDNAFGESRINESAFGRAITGINSFRKALRLTLSVFHAMSYQWQWFAGVHGNKYKKELGGLNPIKAYRMGLKAIAERGDDVKLLIKNGMTYDMNSDFMLDASVKRWSKRLKGPLKVMKPMFTLVDNYNNWLFNRFGSGLKTSAALVELNHLREKYGFFDQDQLARAVGQHVNNDFGGLDLRRMGRNQTLQHLFKLVCMAPDWNESNIRTMTAMAGKYDPLGKGKYSAIGGKNPLMKELARRMYLGGAVKIVALNLVSNFLMAALESNGDDFFEIIDTMEDNYVKAWESGNLNWLKTDITPLYEAIGLGGETDKRRYYGFARHWLDFVKWGTDFPGTAYAKKSFLVSDIITITTGSIFGAMELTTIGDMFEAMQTVTSVEDFAGTYQKWGGARDSTSQWELFPAYVIYSIFNVAPAQVDHILEFAAGRQNALDLLMNVSGLGVSKGEEY